MAAAEARAAWQRAANRCLVQEDAKRAPKLACCPSSSAQQHDINNGYASNAQDHPIPSFMPLNWKPMNSNLPPETKWWLQLQPNFRYQKDFRCEHLNFLDDKIDDKKMESAVSESKLCGEPISEAILEPPWMVPTAFMNHCSEKKVDKLETISSYSQNRQMHSGPQVYVNTENDPPESKLTDESEPSRAQLLEALCHSQTQARKAELAAQKANDDKEHVVKLLFRQASHLVAYKLMLQLESLCIQFKIKEHQIAALFPVLPWMPLKDKSYVRDGRNAVRRKGKKQKSSISIGKYAMIFAVGLGIAGAGLLLGWLLAKL